MIRVLLSDLGQVLLPFDTQRVIDALVPHSSLPGSEIGAILRRLHDKTGFGVGNISGAEFHQRAVAQADLNLGFEEFVVAWSDMFWVDEEVTSLIKAAPVDRRWLLSNTNDLHWRFIQQTYPEVLAPFERHVVSHELRIEKPDPRIFQWILEQTGAPAEEHLFIDDGPANVEAACAMGMDGLLHTDAASLRPALAARGLLPD